MHGADMVQPFTNTDHLFGNGDGVGIFTEYPCDHGIGVACLHHHHAEIVALKHLLCCLVKGHPLSSALLCENFGITQTTFLLTVVPQVDNLDPFEADLIFFRHVGDLFFISQQDRLADTFGVRRFGCLEHIEVVGLREDHPFGVLARHLKQAANHLVVQSHQVAQLVVVLFPIGDRLTGDTRGHCCLCYSRGDGSQQSWIQWFGDDIVPAET